MHTKSQDSQTLTKYQVCVGDWDIHYQHSLDEDDVLSAPVPSSRDIDDRTIKIKTFDTEAEAIKFANEYMLSRKDNSTPDQSDPWLAYVEIRKCTLEVIHKIK